jgi:hypothetical protein
MSGLYAKGIAPPDARRSPLYTSLIRVYERNLSVGFIVPTSACRSQDRIVKCPIQRYFCDLCIMMSARRQARDVGKALSSHPVMFPICQAATNGVLWRV